MPDDRRSPPSTRWYRLAGVLVVLGVVAAGAWWPYATTRVFDVVETFQRTGPLGGPVRLAEAGTHTFWVEGACLSCHDNEPSKYRARATVSVLGPDGQPISLRPAPARVFNTARREGRSLWLFEAPAPGTYRITFDLDTSEGWESTLPGNLAISRGVGLPIGIVRPMAAFALGGLAAGALVAGVTWWRRRRFYERSAAADAAGG